MVKKLVLILSLVFMSFEVIGQSEDEMVTVVEAVPVFGGDLNSFITDKIHYPISAIKDSIEGTVFVEFYIDTVGGTFNHRVLRGLRNDLDEEALRVTRLIRFDSPAKQRGKPVIIRYFVPVRFALNQENEIIKRAVSAMAQDTNDESIEMVSALDSPPSFDNDWSYNKLLNFIKDNLMQIDTLEKTEVVYVQFQIDTMGFTHHHKVLRGVNEQLDAEALRVCRLIKFDHPAKQGGKPVSITYQLPIKFEPRKDSVSQKKPWCFWRRRQH
jgi:protein TonB